MKKQFTQRKTPRVDWLDYNEGMYFITVCTRKHKHLFGEIHDNKMAMTEVGVFLENELNNTLQHHMHIDVLQHVVMPNHFHAIITIEARADMESAPTISEVVQAFKRYAIVEYR
ncbi:MAG: transposase, partial [Paludibacteraceae bacterium]|nr:transposase [Paludibacteraceae bacterium]